MEKRKPVRRRPKPKASTRQVVGAAATAPPVRPKWQKHYQRLTRLLDYLERCRADLAKDALEESPSYSQHMADAATDNFDRDLALGLLSSKQDATYEVEAALDRIRSGRYGICELTGKPIEPKRLAAIPWTRFSAQAERELERDGAVRNTRLGSREAVSREPASKKPG